MANKNVTLNHTLFTEQGACCACDFLRTAIAMMAAEYKPQYQQMLDTAIEEHAKQPEFWIAVNTEVDAWVK